MLFWFKIRNTILSNAMFELRRLGKHFPTRWFFINKVYSNTHMEIIQPKVLVKHLSLGQTVESEARFSRKKIHTKAEIY